MGALQWCNGGEFERNVSNCENRPSEVPEVAESKFDARIYPRCWGVKGSEFERNGSRGVLEVPEYKSDVETYLRCSRMALQGCNGVEFERNVSNFKKSRGNQFSGVIEEPKSDTETYSGWSGMKESEFAWKISENFTLLLNVIFLFKENTNCFEKDKFNLINNGRIRYSVYLRAV